MAVELLLALSTLIVGLIIFLSSRRSDEADGKTLNLPPGHVGGWPFIGDTIPFMKPHSSASLGTYVEQRVAQCGRIFKMNLLGKPTIVSTDPEFNRFILQGEERMFLSSCPTSITKIVGQWSMLSLTGDVHKEMRPIAVNFMNNTKLRTYFLPDIDAQAVSILDSWKVGSSFSAEEEGRKFSFNLMVKHLMNMNLGAPETEELRKQYVFFLAGMASIPLNLPGTAFRRALKSRAAILKLMEQKFDERIQNIEKGSQGLEHDDLLTAVAKHPSFTREQILDMILSLLFAGHETTSIAICLAIYFLSSAPKVLQQLREEHMKITAQKKERGRTGLNWDDYKQMEFTTCVINETLRLGNIVKFLYRTAIKDVQFKGFDIPCGWQVLPVVSAGHLDESIFEDPQSYNPWRWQRNSPTTTKYSNVMSFSDGPRLCPGAELAKLEIAIFLHHLVQRFDWELVENDSPVCFPFLGFPKHLPIKIRPLQN